MSKDDMEHFEARIGDKSLFQGIALFFLSASIPLLIEKLIDYDVSHLESDLAIVIVCIGCIAIGILFQILAWLRGSKVASFKESLFRNERRLSTELTMVDSSSTPSQVGVRTGA